jgi:hypothetical protein
MYMYLIRLFLGTAKFFRSFFCVSAAERAEIFLPLSFFFKAQARVLSTNFCHPPVLEQMPFSIPMSEMRFWQEGIRSMHADLQVKKIS